MKTYKSTIIFLLVFFVISCYSSSDNSNLFDKIEELKKSKNNIGLFITTKEISKEIILKELKNKYSNYNVKVENNISYITELNKILENNSDSYFLIFNNNKIEKILIYKIINNLLIEDDTFSYIQLREKIQSTIDIFNIIKNSELSNYIIEIQGIVNNSPSFFNKYILAKEYENINNVDTTKYYFLYKEFWIGTNPDLKEIYKEELIYIYNKKFDFTRLKKDSLKIENSYLQLGSVRLGETIERNIEIINNLENNIIITRVNSDCMCTVTDFTKKPIEPGQKGNINIIFKGLHLGYNKRSVTVYTNNTYPVELQLSASVIE